MTFTDRALVVALPLLVLIAGFAFTMAALTASQPAGPEGGRPICTQTTPPRS